MINNLIIRKSTSLPMLLEEGGLFSYLEKIKKFPLLSETEEQSLIMSFHQNGDVIAAQKLVTSHLRLDRKSVV